MNELDRQGHKMAKFHWIEVQATKTFKQARIIYDISATQYGAL